MPLRIALGDKDFVNQANKLFSSNRKAILNLLDFLGNLQSEIYSFNDLRNKTQASQYQNLSIMIPRDRNGIIKNGFGNSFVYIKYNCGLNSSYWVKCIVSKEKNDNNESVDVLSPCCYMTEMQFGVEKSQISSNFSLLAKLFATLPFTSTCFVF
jgi:hypothetical protein